MNQPSLAVLFIGGWGLAPDKRENLLWKKGGAFLENYSSRFPAVSLQPLGPSDGIIQTYQRLGHGNSLMGETIRAGCRQVIVADANRYGLLSENLYHGIEQDEDLFRDYYVQTPPFRTMADDPAATAIEIMDVFTNAFRRGGTQALFLGALSGIWASLRYKDIRVLKRAIEDTERAATKIIERALEAEIRLLVISDSSGAESLISPEGSFRDTFQPQPLPCLLIDEACEGLQAAGDLGEAGYAKQPVGTIDDIAPTILTALGFTVPQGMPGRPLFTDFL